MQTLTIRRRTNGTIDIDGYRQEALMLRAQMMTGTLKKFGRLPWRYAGVAAIVAAYLVLLPHLSAADAAAAAAAPAASARADIAAAR
ncbi:MAG: hypothetical protein ACK4UO_07670 [Pseudolabrys sp.]